ncbi:MAG: bifunctional diguanylate cyclase/phosphodiesterase [Persephonella sp.]|nr:bifunctional diguanylate cyclase/phosphodiesterase [Persephonella sp.]
MKNHTTARFTVSLPIFVNNRLKYLITLYSKDEYRLSEKQINMFEEMAYDISIIASYIKQGEDLYRKEYYDSVTGFGNRKLLYEKIDEFISKKENFYIIMLDIYNFKRINELYGTKIADTLLKEIGITLLHSLRTNYVFRIGSDEFVILWEGDVYKALEIIRNSLKEHFLIRGRSISINFNLAIVQYPKDGKFRMELLLKAERTLQKAKEEGKDIIMFFDTEFYSEIKNYFEIEELIDESLKTGRFFVEYQPVVSFSTDRIVGVEVLLRMYDKNEDIISPNRFIPVAEKSGQIIMLDTIALRRSIKELRPLLESGKLEFFSINLTPTNIRLISEIFMPDKGTNFLKNELSEKDVEIMKKYLTIELTERQFLEITRHSEHIKKLRSEGIKIAVDDFGTGYSSLSYLSQLEPDFLKIDHFFVKDIISDDRTWKIVQSIISIGKPFDQTIIVEGIESKEQYQKLKEAGCDMFPGILLLTTCSYK